MTALETLKPDEPISLTTSWGSQSNRWSFGLENKLEQRDAYSQYFSEYVPTCDIDETEKTYLLSMDVPGLEPDDITVEVADNSVIVSGERKEEKGCNSYRYERRFGKFMRAFSLPESVKEDDIVASYEKGVLFLTLPKMKKSRAKLIKVKSGKS